MEKTVLKVEGMSCMHCVRAVKGAVSALDGVESVEVDLTAKSVMVERDPAQANLAAIRAAIEDAGYDVLP